jgi:hypothetical protein
MRQLGRRDYSTLSWQACRSARRRQANLSRGGSGVRLGCRAGVRFSPS